ncbi:MAG: signal peptidase I [Thermodesulfobacteriota bacterium]
MDSNLISQNISTNPESSIANSVLDLWQEIGKETKLDLSGMSMLPLIKDGDSVVICHTREGIRAGSIVAFRKDQKIIVHRVIKIEKDDGKTAFLTKGDFNLKPDYPFHEDLLIGKVIAIKREGRQINLDTTFWSVIGRITSTFSFILSLNYRIYQFQILRLYNRLFT